MFLYEVFHQMQSYPLVLVQLRLVSSFPSPLFLLQLRLVSSSLFHPCFVHLLLVYSSLFHPCFVHLLLVYSSLFLLFLVQLLHGYSFPSLLFLVQLLLLLQTYFPERLQRVSIFCFFSLKLIIYLLIDWYSFKECISLYSLYLTRETSVNLKY